MTSKWIEEIEKLVDNEDSWEFILPKLLEIDKLLRRCMFEVDNDELFAKILQKMDELSVSKKTATGRIVTGVSSVVPVTNEEAERIFKEVEENGD